jgi:hypothetical protein
VTVLSREQPYPGLRPFDSGDEEFFFGRETQTRGLRQKLAASRLVAVVGRSGCGKSSLVRAGLVPLLAKESSSDGQQIWCIASFRPQGRPIAQLTEELLWLASDVRSADRGAPAGAERSKPADVQGMRRSRLDAMLRRSSRGLVEAAAELGLPERTELLIIVDQFEEIFRFEGARGSDADEATAFVRLLMEAIHAESMVIRVILTMRLDFLGDCARFPQLPEAISDGQFLVPNLSRAERRAAIEEPARKCGAVVTPAVTQRLLNEIGDDPDQLPVLQHVLMRTWQQAGGGEIRLEHYLATGGVAKAISRHADDVFKALPSDEHRSIAERMFKAISELDRRGRAIRRPLPVADIAAVAAAHEDSVRRVVDMFRAPECCFLMPPAAEPLTERTPIDISHESLLRGWEKMTGERPGEGWLAEEDRDGKIYRSLVEAAETFEKDSRAVLPRALNRLREAWRRKAKPNAAWAERYGNRFELVEELLDQSARRQRIARWVGAGMAAVMLVGFVMYGYQRWETARQAEQAAEARFNHQAAERAQAARYAAEAATRQQEVGALQQEVARLQAQLRARGVQTRTDDNVQQVAVPTIDARQANASSAITNLDGYMWVGSVPKSNLLSPAGAVVPPTEVRVGGQYIVTQNIYLRSGLPDASYAQQPSVGVVAPNSRIEVLEMPVPFERPTGQQYWMKVRVVASASLPTVYFQYATAQRAQAQAFSLKLQALGYKLPGEERVDAAQGKREVRYFYALDKEAAEKLAQDTTRTLQDLGYPAAPPATTRSMLTVTDKKNVPGVVELWVDLVRAAAAN